MLCSLCTCILSISDLFAGCISNTAPPTYKAILAVEVQWNCELLDCAQSGRNRILNFSTVSVCLCLCEPVSVIYWGYCKSYWFVVWIACLSRALILFLSLSVSLFLTLSLSRASVPVWACEYDSLRILQISLICGLNCLSFTRSYSFSV